MKPDEDLFVSIIIAWVVVVTIVLGILLPYTVNVPALPALFYKTMTGSSVMTPVPGFSTSPSGTDNPEGLLVRYTFEDDLYPGNHVFLDHSGNNNNAVANGIFITQAPGIIGNFSVLLPGTGYLFSDPDPAAGRTNVTFSLWFTVPDQARNYRLASALSATGPRTGWILGTKSSELWDGEGNPIRVLTGTRSAGNPPFTPWNHKVLVYNGSHVTEYLNGIVVSRYAASGKPLGTGRGMMIGTWQPFGQNYAGQIDEFRVYDRALDGDMVAALYRQGMSPADHG